MDIKPGYLTTEFWLVVGNTLLMILATAGIITQDQAEDFKALWAPLAGAVVGIAFYVWSRTRVKGGTAVTGEVVMDIDEFNDHIIETLKYHGIDVDLAQDGQPQ